MIILMAMIYIFAGCMHFYKPKFYLKMMPPYLPNHLPLVYISGFVEIVLGSMLLITRLQIFAAWGIILLLVAVFPANFYMYQKGGKFFRVPDWLLFIRLPVQLLLIFWAYLYT